MAKDINELTPEQEKLLDVYAERWIKIGLDTTQADRPRAEGLIKKIYAELELAEPKIEWFDSPVGAIKKLKEMGESQPLNAAIYCQHDASWCAHLAYAREVLGLVEETDPIKHHLELAQCCHWWFAYDVYVAATDRPVELHLNARGNMHRLDGPALRYKDGDAIYAVDGTVIEADLVEKRSELTVARALQESNIEIRRAMLTLMPADAISKEAKLVSEDVDDLGLPRKLFRVEVPDDEAIVIVEVKDSTEHADGSRRTYHLRVPPDITTPSAAVAWSFGLEPRQYHPEIET